MIHNAVLLLRSWSMQGLLGRGGQRLSLHPYPLLHPQQRSVVVVAAAAAAATQPQALLVLQPSQQPPPTLYGSRLAAAAATTTTATTTTGRQMAAAVLSTTCNSSNHQRTSTTTFDGRTMRNFFSTFRPCSEPPRTTGGGGQVGRRLRQPQLQQRQRQQPHRTTIRQMTSTTIMLMRKMKMNHYCPPPHYHDQMQPLSRPIQLQCGGRRRWYTPLTKEEEMAEQVRVKTLTPFQKDQELRQYNRQLARLELLKGINTGEIYTWSGRYKALARDYGLPLFAYYWVVWTTTAVICYGAITVFHIDTLALLSQLDHYTGYDVSSKVDPEMGKIGMAILCNELLEPVRLPAVILTVKPVMDNLFPPKY